MSLVDPTLANDPSNPTPAASANNTGATVAVDEYTVRCQQIVCQGFHVSGGKMVANTGNAYLVRKPQGSGTGNLADPGVITLIIPAGATAVLASAPLNRNVFSPYRYRVDADVNNEG